MSTVSSSTCCGGYLRQVYNDEFQACSCGQGFGSGSFSKEPRVNDYERQPILQTTSGELGELTDTIFRSTTRPGSANHTVLNVFRLMHGPPENPQLEDYATVSVWTRRFEANERHYDIMNHAGRSRLIQDCTAGDPDLARANELFYQNATNSFFGYTASYMSNSKRIILIAANEGFLGRAFCYAHKIAVHRAPSAPPLIPQERFTRYVYGGPERTRFGNEQFGSFNFRKTLTVLCDGADSPADVQACAKASYLTAGATDTSIGTVVVSTYNEGIDFDTRFAILLFLLGVMIVGSLLVRFLIPVHFTILLAKLLVASVGQRADGEYVPMRAVTTKGSSKVDILVGNDVLRAESSHVELVMAGADKRYPVARGQEGLPMA